MVVLSESTQSTILYSFGTLDIHLCRRLEGVDEGTFMIPNLSEKGGRQINMGGGHFHK